MDKVDLFRAYDNREWLVNKSIELDVKYTTVTALGIIDEIITNLYKEQPDDYKRLKYAKVVLQYWEDLYPFIEQSYPPDAVFSLRHDYPDDFMDVVVVRDGVAMKNLYDLERQIMFTLYGVYDVFIPRILNNTMYIDVVYMERRSKSTIVTRTLDRDGFEVDLRRKLR